VISQVNRIRNGKDVNVLAQVAALAALEDLAYMEGWVREVRASRSWLVRQLRLRGYEVHPSPANFILVGVDAPRDLVEQLRRRGIYVRDRSGMIGLSRYVRVTIGTRAESKRLLAALDDVRGKEDAYAAGAPSVSRSSRRSARVQNSQGEQR
jgi:histidinol-phosphate aminotransferase